MAVVISDRLLEGGDRLLDAEPDEQLLSLVQSGHQAAFAAIVRRYEGELQGQARRLTSDGRGEDAVQQAFLNAFTALQRGGEVRHLRGWLHQILRHEITRSRVPVDVPLEAAAAYGEPLEDTVQRRATAHATLAQLSALPDRQRDALLGTAVLGFPRAHVARTMGLSEGAVRQLVHRARLRLRQAASALIPFPLVKLFGAARSGVDAAPDAALGAGSAASGGLVIKVGALLASGVVATGIAVTHTLPLRHHATAPTPGARHHAAHAREAGHVAPAPAASVAPSNPAFITSSLHLHEHGPAGLREGGRSHGGPGRLQGTRSGRRDGPGSGEGRGGGPGHGGSSTGPGDDGSGPSAGSTSGSGPEGGGSGSQSGSGTGHQGGSESVTGSAGSGSGSGSGDGGGASGGGHGSGRSGSDAGSVSPADGDASTASASGISGSAPGTSTTVTGDETSGDGGGNSDSGSSDGGGSGNGGKENSSGSRDVSGSLGSSSS
jgi:RNA polymerase sigma factor (sigma-70 family)